MSRVADLLHNAMLRLPGFESYWTKHHQDSDSPHVYEVFLHLANYLEDHIDEFSDEDLKHFWEWIGWQMESPDSDIEYAVHTTFLEAIADTQVETRSRDLMPALAKDFVDQFMQRGRKRRWFEN